MCRWRRSRIALESVVLTNPRANPKPSLLSALYSTTYPSCLLALVVRNEKIDSIFLGQCMFAIPAWFARTIARVDFFERQIICEASTHRAVTKLLYPP